jgi:hypothetical protein
MAQEDVAVGFMLKMILELCPEAGAIAFEHVSQNQQQLCFYKNPPELTPDYRTNMEVTEEAHWVMYAHQPLSFWKDKLHAIVPSLVKGPKTVTYSLRTRYPQGQDPLSTFPLAARFVRSMLEKEGPGFFVYKAELRVRDAKDPLTIHTLTIDPKSLRQQRVLNPAS